MFDIIKDLVVNQLNCSLRNNPYNKEKHQMISGNCQVIYIHLKLSLFYLFCIRILNSI